MRVEKPETYNQPKLQNSFDQLQEYGQPRPNSVYNRSTPVVPTLKGSTVQNDNMPPNEKRNQDLQTEILLNRTTLNFARDTEINQMVLRIKNERGEVLVQIPEEARLRVARHIRKTYEQPRLPILNSEA